MWRPSLISYPPFLGQVYHIQSSLTKIHIVYWLYLTTCIQFIYICIKGKSNLLQTPSPKVMLNIPCVNSWNIYHHTNNMVVTPFADQHNMHYCKVWADYPINVWKIAWCTTANMVLPHCCFFVFENQSSWIQNFFDL